MSISPDDPFYHQIIRIEAEALAKRQHVDPERVVAVFERLGSVDWLAPQFPWYTAVDEAANVLGFERAFRMFETEDLVDLIQRVALVDYLSDSHSPLFTVEELTAWLAVSAQELAGNQEPLVQWGYPRELLAVPPWLALRLQTLLPVKAPFLSVNPRSVRAEAALTSKDGAVRATSSVSANASGRLQFTYVWTKDSRQPSHSTETDFGPLIMVPMGGDAADVCEYSQARPVEGVTSAVVERVATLRPRLLQARLDLLGVLADSLRRQAADRVWPVALKLLTDRFQASELDFILEVEDALKEWDPMAEFLYMADAQFFVMHRGGIRDMFELAGHCESELKIGAYDRVARSLGEILDLSRPQTYYDICSEGHRSEGDRALDTFLDDENRTKMFWIDFDRRVNLAIAEDFSEVVTISMRVRRPYVAHFEPVVRTFAEWQKRAMESGGRALLTDDVLRAGQPAGAVTLSVEEERQFAEQALRSRVLIEITGCRPRVLSNMVVIAGKTVTMGDTTLVLLLRLVIGLRESAGGWIDFSRGRRDGSLQADIGTDRDAYKMFHDLRRVCQPALGDLSGTDFIQVDREHGVRLSTLPAYVRVDLERLAVHPASHVRALTQRLKALWSVK